MGVMYPVPMLHNYCKWCTVTIDGDKYMNIYLQENAQEIRYFERAITNLP